MWQKNVQVGVAAVLSLLTVQGAGAQERRQGAGGGNASPEYGEPRNALSPFAGLWHGARAMGPGEHEPFGLRFTAIDGKYVGYMIVGDGGKIPELHLAATAQGLRWDSPNSGGGTWYYDVRLASQDSLVGTLVLRDAPDFPEQPKGTLVLTRVPVKSAGKP